jgi:hypothetical protein
MNGIGAVPNAPTVRDERKRWRAFVKTRHLTHKRRYDYWHGDRRGHLTHRAAAAEMSRMIDQAEREGREIVYASVS